MRVPWLPLAIVAFALNLVWEFAQAPLYVHMAHSSWRAVAACVVASIGDAMIAVLAYAAVSVIARDRWWVTRHRTGLMIVYIGLGLVVTIGLELINVRVLGRWSYSPKMPQLWRVGVTPLLQWLALPPVTLTLVRRLLGRSTRRPRAEHAG